MPVSLSGVIFADRSVPVGILNSLPIKKVVYRLGVSGIARIKVKKCKFEAIEKKNRCC
jgi:hypothetical protein